MLSSLPPNTHRMRTPLFVDFDYTLFDAGAYREAIINCFGPENKQEALAAYTAHTKEGHYRPDHHIAAFTQDPEEQKKIYTRFEELTQTAADYLYPDTLDFLRSLSATPFQPFLLTLGDPDYQASKVLACGISGYFDAVYYTAIPKSHYLQGLVKSDDMFGVIDDSPDNLRSVLGAFPKAYAVFVDRKNIYTASQIGRALHVAQLDQSALTYLQEALAAK